MPYDKKIKADSEIFEKIRFIPVGDRIILKPIIPELIEQEATLYLFNTNNEGVKKYLPSVYVSDKTQAVEKLSNFISRMRLKQSLFYCIRLKQPPFPIGYINLNTPLAQTGLDSWTVDFWMADSIKGKGLMSSSWSHILAYLQKHDITEVKALVNTDNTNSISTLERVGFKFVSQEKEGEKRFLYSVQLN